MGLIMVLAIGLTTPSSGIPGGVVGIMLVAGVWGHHGAGARRGVLALVLVGHIGLRTGVGTVGTATPAFTAHGTLHGMVVDSAAIITDSTTVTTQVPMVVVLFVMYVLLHTGRAPLSTGIPAAYVLPAHAQQQAPVQMAVLVAN